MDAFARFSSSARFVAALALSASLPGLGCVDELDPLEGTSSLRVELLEPADPGAIDDRLDDSQRQATLRITPIDTEGLVDTSFSGTVDLYSHYLGSLTPELGEEPLAQVEIDAGEPVTVSVDLPAVYGPSFLWVEHVSGDAPTYATGTSPQLWFRNAFLADVSRPEDEMSLVALERSPLEAKQVHIDASRYGDPGRMVVTGVYAQGYTLSDVSCQDPAGTPPCTTGDYDHVFIFTFSRAEDEEHRRISRGHVIDTVTGAVSEFNGLTEVNFPQSFVTDPEPHPELVPEPVVIQPEWLSTRIELERVEAGLVALDDAIVCPVDEDYETYSQWKLDIGLGCGEPINIISKGEVAEFDPEAHVGETLTRVVGTLRPVNIGSFNVWIVYPRDMGDIEL